uniref:Uncharacterized protein n=1 Tax=viral metagenome TaxID=1070528 RepID=A0A6C0KRM4_9ZZZZ
MDSETENIFNNKIQENGLNFYLFPAGFQLFKASKYINSSKPEITFEQNTPYFFGLKNMNPKYISSYEKEYGVIFEYQIITPYKLLALDDQSNLSILYSAAPDNIKKILEKNYGFIENSNLEIKRDSEAESDREFSKYLCKLGFQGYAISKMATSFQGTFHPELLICNTNGIKFVNQITSKEKMMKILEDAKLKKLADDIKLQRNNRRRERLNNDDHFDNSPNKFRRGISFNLDNMDLDGGSIKKFKKRSKKAKKSSIIKRKRKLKTKRKKYF